jgi:hypothetical protein
VVRSPAIRAAAERRGIRTDDVTFTSYEWADHKITLRHSDGEVSSFHLEDADRPPPCPTCGR